MTFHNIPSSRSATDDGVYRALAKKILDDRLRRAEFLPNSLFNEAAWDAALIIFSGEPGLLHCAVSLADRLGQPLTTMTRWIAVLENEGLIEARRSTLCPEREPVRLSESGRSAIQAYLRATASMLNRAIVPS